MKRSEEREKAGEQGEDEELKTRQDPLLPTPHSSSLTRAHQPAQVSRRVTLRLNTGLSAVWSRRSATK